MKKLIGIIAITAITLLSSCYVEIGGPGYHHHHRGYYPYGENMRIEKRAAGGQVLQASAVSHKKAERN